MAVAGGRDAGSAFRCGNADHRVTEGVNPPGANVSFAGPGGNKFKFTLPANSDTAITGNGVFNLSSERVFSIAAAQTQRYALKIGPVRLDSSVFCLVEDAALTVLFIPN